MLLDWVNPAIQLNACSSFLIVTPTMQQGPTASPEQAVAAVAAAALIARQYTAGEEPDCKEQQPGWLQGTRRVRFRGEADVAQLMEVVEAAHRNASTCPQQSLADVVVSTPQILSLWSHVFGM